MNRFFKENFALVAGIALPLVLIVLFFAAGKVTQSTVPDPQYDAVIVTNYYPEATNNPWDISVHNGNIVIKEKAVKEGVTPRTQKPDFYVLDHKTMATRKLAIDLSKAKDGSIDSPALAKINESRIDGNRTSPDGYTFEYNYRSGGGIFNELFFDSRYRRRYVLRNGVRTIPIKSDRYYYKTEVLGWVTGP